MDKVALIGVPLDPDEREHAVDIKHNAYARKALAYHDPYTALCKRFTFPRVELGNAPIDSWLTPFPSEDELFLSTVENYVAFTDTDGCWDAMMFVKESMDKMVGDMRSLMIAVDHCVACASILRASEKYGKEDLGLVIFDSHFDGILPCYRSGLIQHDIETNPDSPFDPNDPFISGRAESFNADSFLFRLIDEKYVLPENIIVAGVSDYPPEKDVAADGRVNSYIDFYKGYEKKGLKIVPKQHIGANPRAFDPSSLGVSNLHVSVDIDVGSRNAIYGARFIDYKGLSSKQIYSMIQKVVDSGKKIVSADISEIDVWKAGIKHYGKKDATYDVAAKVGNMLFSK